MNIFSKESHFSKTFFKNLNHATLFTLQDPVALL